MILFWSQTMLVARLGDQASIALILANPSLDHHFWTSCARQFFSIVWRPAVRFAVLCFCAQKKLKPALLDILNIYASGFTHIWVCDSAIAIFSLSGVFFFFWRKVLTMLFPVRVKKIKKLLHNWMQLHSTAKISHQSPFDDHICCIPPSSPTLRQSMGKKNHIYI